MANADPKSCFGANAEAQAAASCFYRPELLALQVTTVALFALAVATVAVRLFARVLVVRKVGASDCWICGALILTAGVFATFLLSTPFLGKNRCPKLAPAETFMQLSWVFTMVYVPAIWSVKVSLLLLYYQLSPIESYRRIVYIVGGIITAHTVAAELVGFHRLNLVELVDLQCFQVSVFECRPVGVLWNHNFTESTRCINIPAFLTANASLNALSDVVIWFMPIPIILTLRINYRKKIAILTCIALGFISVSASIYRLYAVIRYSKLTGYSWKWVLVPLAAVVELTSAIIATSLPSIYPLFRRFVPDGLLSGQSSFTAPSDFHVSSSVGRTEMECDAS
ncbi:MAG: hypothetical protein M1813_005981 [Trichoglossum hirsutum]|nr:MAG: hypothetical protein M1813_005981 [Trichoglossum hirsutum]